MIKIHATMSMAEESPRRLSNEALFAVLENVAEWEKETAALLAGHIVAVEIELGEAMAQIARLETTA